MPPTLTGRELSVRIITRTRSAALALVALAAVGVAGCAGGGSAQPAAGRVSPHHATRGAGTVRVLYAGSLLNVMEHDLGPAFAKATGATYLGYGAGSTQVANEIKGKTRRGDVFISASPKVNATLEGSAHGGWVSWYATFAKSPLLLGYSPDSKFAHQLKTEPWYQVVTQPGFRLGRTDPTLDPKGKLTAQAIDQVAVARHNPGLAKAILANAAVFPEEELVGRLQAGQLDAGFFYSVETTELKIPTVALTPIDLSASYTVTVLNKAENRSGAVDFVSYLLGPNGRAILKRHGLNLLNPPQRSGPTAAVPAELKPRLGG